MEHVTIGIDRDPASRVAIDWVLTRAEQLRLDIRLLIANDMLMWETSQDEQALDDASRYIHDMNRDLDVTMSLIDGGESETLVDASRTADLLVLGSHRNKHLLSVLNGALPARVAARAHCPTVIVPNDWTANDGGVMVGISNDDSCCAALFIAAAEARRLGTRLDIVHAWQMPNPGLDAVASMIVDREDMRQLHLNVLMEAKREVLSEFSDLEVHGHLDELHPAIALARRARTASMLVVGTHRRSPVTGLLLGSTVLDLLYRSATPVWVVPPTPVAAPVPVRAAHDVFQCGAAVPA